MELALENIYIDKTLRADGIPIEIWRVMRDIVMVWLILFFCIGVLNNKKMPNDWKINILLSIFKNEGGIFKIVLFI